MADRTATSIVADHAAQALLNLQLISFSPKIPLHQNPALIIISIILLIATSLIYIPPKRLPRLFALTIILIHASQVLRFIQNAPPASHIYHIISALGLSLHASLLLVLTLTTPSSTLQTAREKATWALDKALNPRSIPTTTTTTTTTTTNNPTPSSRSHFLTSRFLSLLLNFTFLTALSILDTELYTPFLQPGDYAPVREHFLRRLSSVTPHEILIRLYLPIQCFANQHATLSLYHSLLSMIAVGVLGQRQVERWPALYGDVREAWGLRRFWSLFWNRVLRRAFVAHASWVTYSICRIRRGTWLARLSVMVLVFVISGVMHAVPLKLLGGECAAWPVVRWYLLVVGGIVVEDLVLGAVKYLGLLTEGAASGKKRYWRYIGYVWVWCWFSWSLPKLVFPNWMCWAVDS